MRRPDTSRPLDLSGRVVLVTGGAGDIGSAVAAQAARLGATVVIADNGTSVTGVGEDPGRAVRVAERLAAEYGSVVGHHCDLTDADQVDELFEDMLSEHGAVDAVVAAAATVRVRPVWELTPDDWRTVFDSQASHTYLVAAAACRRWRQAAAPRSGSPRSLVTLTAATGLVGRPDLGVAHSASKGAIVGMTLELAHEMYPYGVSVNAVAEANVRGRVATHVGAQLSCGDSAFDASSPDHVGTLAAYLASGDAPFVTGQVFRVVGGLIGRYRGWEVTRSLDHGGFRTIDELRPGIRRLFDAYPQDHAGRP
ncbi:NAD(P)-dependent dehydrogenase (short-subunit alcohol dehydrogenase family) [Kitasatospora sp. MAP12-15]|uniref:SDR family NAD(P)-dependent oxidoreductase n=1 Tax=unclassified Kitasatospora TaxID=2633591 RepID=UPI0024761353|nr:SDR family oxidoreductase [Kitasatospora sp. MAP12-44]MDH6108209.1 NAD(P)-dependent dehydrogenase (short-subunit alcohol dehydrogenase family) [Kitasatospora sp. MAP12-44]